MIYKIDYELYSILLQDYQENITDYKNRAYLLNYFIVYNETCNKYICVNNIIYHWETIEFDTITECVKWFITINFSINEIKNYLKTEKNYFNLIKSFIKTQEDFINKYNDTNILKLDKGGLSYK